MPSASHREQVLIESRQQVGSGHPVVSYDDIENLIEPDELRILLDATDQARQHWDNCPRSTRRAILEWINSAKTATTRTTQIEKTAADAVIDIRANPWRQPHRTGR